MKQGRGMDIPGCVGKWVMGPGYQVCVEGWSMGWGVRGRFAWELDEKKTGGLLGAQRGLRPNVWAPALESGTILESP